MSTLSTLLRGGLRLSFLRTPRQVAVQVGIAPDVIEKDRAKAEELTGTVARLTTQLAELAD